MPWAGAGKSRQAALLSSKEAMLSEHPALRRGEKRGEEEFHYHILQSSKQHTNKINVGSVFKIAKVSPLQDLLYHNTCPIYISIL